MTGTLPQAVAAEIRAEMARQRLTQQALGAKVGLKQEQISRRLTGDVEITVADLERIAVALGKPVTHFMPRPVSVAPLPADPEIRSIPRDDDYGREIAA